MIHVGRSGSSVVGDLLNQHPQMMWDSEIYQRVFREREFEDHSLPPITDVNAVGYLVERSRKVISRYYGFEAKFFHLRSLGIELAPYLDALDERIPNIHFIVLERKNTLRVVASTLAARETGTWHQRAHTSPVWNRIQIDPGAVFVNRANSRLVDLLEEFNRDFIELKHLLAKRPSLYLTYEEDVMEDPQRAYKKICEFLELPAYKATVQYSRTNPYPLRELIGNFDEIKAVLRGSDFEWMLDEG